MAEKERLDFGLMIYTGTVVSRSGFTTEPNVDPFRFPAEMLPYWGHLQTHTKSVIVKKVKYLKK